MIPDVPESLPPRELMPDRVYALPALRYSVRLNVGAELLDRQADGDHAVRPAIHADAETITYVSCGGRTSCPTMRRP